MGQHTPQLKIGNAFVRIAGNNDTPVQVVNTNNEMVLQLYNVSIQNAPVALFDQGFRCDILWQIFSPPTSANPNNWDVTVFSKWSTQIFNMQYPQDAQLEDVFPNGPGDAYHFGVQGSLHDTFGMFFGENYAAQQTGAGGCGLYKFRAFMLVDTVDYAADSTRNGTSQWAMSDDWYFWFE